MLAQWASEEEEKHLYSPESFLFEDFKEKHHAAMLEKSEICICSSSSSAEEAREEETVTDKKQKKTLNPNENASVNAENGKEKRKKREKG
jgi:hypothetical protein